MKRIFALIASLMTLTASSAYADETPPATWQFNVFGGINHSDVSEGLLYYPSGAIDSLHNTSMGNQATGGLGVAYRSTLRNRPATLGIDWTYLNNRNDGYVYVDRVATLNNYRYNLDLKTWRLMLNGELAFCDIWQGLMPFVNIGAGIARTNVRYYHNPNTLKGISGGELRLHDKTSTTPAFSFGLGLKKSISEHVEVFAAYQLSDLGTIKSSKQTNSVTLLKPMETDLRTHAFLIGLHYLFM